MPDHHHPGHRHRPRLTGPQATLLLRAVHLVRSRLDAPEDDTRHLTLSLASAAGIPPEAGPWRTDVPLPTVDVMRAVRTGMAAHRVLYVHHLQQDGEVRRLHVEPYHVTLESGFWYVLCRLTDTGRERVLRLDRVLSAAPEDPFEPRPIDLDRYLGGIFVPEDPGATATVRFAARSADYAQERWGNGTEHRDGSVDIEIPYQRDHFLIRTLVEFGADFEIISPAAIRAGVRDRALATLTSWREGPPQ